MSLSHENPDMILLSKKVRDQTWINDMELKRIGKASPLLYCPNVECRGSRIQLDKTKCKQCLLGASECTCKIFAPQVIIRSSNPYCAYCNGYDIFGIARSLKGKSSSPWVSTAEDFCSESNIVRIIDYIQSIIFKYSEMDGVFWKKNSTTGVFEKTHLYSKFWTTNRHIHTRNGMDVLFESFKRIKDIMSMNSTLERVKHLCMRNVIRNPADTVSNEILRVIEEDY